MKVKVKYLSRAREISKKLEEEVNLDGSSLEDLIDLLILKYGETFERYVYSSNRLNPLILVDGKMVNDKEYKLKEGSEVVFMSAIGGGN
ncbi:hypothetical protein HRbin06_00390 [archaeon HR06]|nr:hypothetical protein HRbin06_00390 [archaeon HR06]